MNRQNMQIANLLFEEFFIFKSLLCKNAQSNNFKLSQRKEKETKWKNVFLKKESKKFANREKTQIEYNIHRRLS